MTPALLLALLGLLPTDAPAIPFAPKHYVCQRAAVPPKVDGVLDDGVWKLAAWTEDFQDIEGFLKPKPRFRTRAKLAWDDTHLYIAAELEEPDVWATLTQRDSVIYQDPDFEVFLDPAGSTSPYYELEVNALNTVWDLLLRYPYRDGPNPGAAIHGYDMAGLRTAVAIQGTLNQPGDTDTGWTVEIAIPFAAVTEALPQPGPPKPGDRWRLNFSRVQWSTEVREGRTLKRKGPDGQPLPEDNWVWSPQGAIRMHMPEMWGFLHFSPRPTGSEESRRTLTEEDEATWGLRRIYYAQRAHKTQHGTYASTLKELGLTQVLPRGWGLWMEAGERQWMAEARWTGTPTRITIDTRGAVETQR